MSNTLTAYIRVYILTDMKRILLSVDDSIAPLLQAEPNASKLMRDLLRNHYADIPTSVNNDIRQGTVQLYKLLREVDAKVDYIADHVAKP